MNVYDILILTAVALAVAGAVAYLIRLKKKGKSVCCGDCSKCAAGCANQNKDKNRNGGS